MARTGHYGKCLYFEVMNRVDIKISLMKRFDQSSVDFHSWLWGFNANTLEGRCSCFEDQERIAEVIFPKNC